jgi:hypothetical protein
MIVGISSWAHAATRAEVNVLEATETIRYLSQKITKNYLYLYINPRKKEIGNVIRRDLGKLVESIRTISMTTSDEDTKSILEFLTYSKDQIERLVQAKPDKEKAALMLDYSETLLEGANSIARGHSYDFTESEKMLMKSKSIEYLLERSAKYYMALGMGLGTDVNRFQMQEAMEELEKNLKDIESYEYPSQMGKNKQALRECWEVTKSLFVRREKMFVSNLMALSTDELENITLQFVLYHRKTQ